MENQVSSKSIILNYGLYLGVASIISLIMYALGMHLEQNWISGTLGFVVMIVLIVLGIKKFKELNGGFLSWGQAVKIGVGITVISALISVVYQQIFINFIEPDYMNQMMEIQNQKMVDMGYTEEQIEAGNAMANKMKGPFISSAMAIIGGAVIGFIVSAIAGAFMKESAEEEY